MLLLPCAFAAALIGFSSLVPGQRFPELFRAALGAGSLLLGWSVVLLVAARLANRKLTLEVAVHRHHWVQACAQFSVLLYWGWHVRFVYAYLPLILAQLLFAYGFDSLLTWTRRERYSLGFGAFPIVFSINLFLWFKPEFFHWQFAMVAVGYLAKEFIRWNKEGRSAHVFNPSSFPLALSALVLILTESADVTLTQQIVSSQYSVPALYLVIFLVALPGQLLFGVARMTMVAVVSLYAISVTYFGASGTYLFYDAHIPVPVFLGMHLLFTDPSTSPRTGLGRIIYGLLYAVGVAIFFVLLGWVGAPTYFDKLLPLPILNLLVRRIDATVDSLSLAGVRRWAPVREFVVGHNYPLLTSVWFGTFVVLSTAGGVGDRHPGQYLPFWEQTCQTGKSRACGYLEYMQSVFCSKGSGWACNEWGVRLTRESRSAEPVFRRGCELGFEPACRNAERARSGDAALARAQVPVEELPIVLGWKRPPRERDPDRLLALACEQGWTDMCGASRR